jgi:hypothetical protein
VRAIGENESAELRVQYLRLFSKEKPKNPP